MPSATAARRNAMVDNFAAAHNSGFLKFYAGAVPANADAALGEAILLGTCAFAATAFASADGGIAVANAIGSDIDADATNTAAFARSYASDETTVLGQWTVGLADAEVILTTLDIVEHGTIAVTSASLTMA